MRHLLSTPLQLKHHTLKNRIIMGSMHTGFEDHPQGAIPLAAFYTARAKGGVALIITGGISPNAAGVLIEGGAKLTNAAEMAWHQPITHAVHQADSKICLQILHAGRYAKTHEPLAPSAIATPINPIPPRAMTYAEIQQTIQDYIHCAKLAQQAGYDGVEIMGSEGYLINQFLAPATNQRTDEYGGNMENRHRIAIEITKGIRTACGEKFLIVYRFSLADFVANGSTWTENEALAQALAKAGADLFNTGIGWHESRIPTIATAVPRGAFATLTAKLKAISPIPVVASNRINMPDVAEAILQKGQADAISMARPFLADADWVKKAFAQQDDAINTCIACNQACLDHIFVGKQTTCLVNPFAGNELTLIPHPITSIKNIAVIGAGPAGMAFAKTAAERGHRITLFDSQSTIGGQLNIAKTIPSKPEFHSTLRYFDHALTQAGVHRILGKTVTINDLIGFDEIVLATGITPRQITFEGSNHPNVLSYLNVLKDKHPISDSVAIIGAGGIAFDVAEYLSHSGTDSALSPKHFAQEWSIDNSLKQAGALLNTAPQFTRTTRQIWMLQRSTTPIGTRLGKTTGWIHLLTLKYRGVQMLNDVEYLKFDDAGLHIRHKETIKQLPVKQIVICAGQEPNRHLADECQAKGLPVHLIGGVENATHLDAKRAIYEGTVLGLTL